ncbi:MAG TPA: DUF4190 domain-containing protein [Nocardioidaceae bacterium]|jgi:hypothetical protein
MTNTPGDEPPGDQRPGDQWPGEGAPPPYPPYGQYPPGYAPPPPQYVPEHPRATLSLVLGLIGLLACQVVSPVAWVIGKRTVDEIDASRGAVGGRGQAQAGYVLGIVGTVLLGLGVVAAIVYVVVMVAVIGGVAFNP